MAFTRPAREDILDYYCTRLLTSVLESLTFFSVPVTLEGIQNALYLGGEKKILTKSDFSLY